MGEEQADAPGEDPPVDSAHQIIVAHATLNEHIDTPQLPAIVRLIKINTGRQTEVVSADAGYLPEANLRERKRRHFRGYIATARQRDGATATPPPKRGPNTGPLTVLMTDDWGEAGGAAGIASASRSSSP